MRRSECVSASNNMDRQQSLEEANRRMEAGRLNQAESLLSELIGSHPGDPEVCRLLAKLHIKQGELGVASSEIQFLAEAALRAEDYALAESMILEYLQVDSQSVALLELLGRTYEHTSKREEAAAQYGRALEILLQEPDPEMPTRPVELYDKITVLAPESPLLMRFASAFSSVPSQPSSPSPDEAVSS